jgi:uncharacterized protein YjlB
MRRVIAADVTQPVDQRPVVGERRVEADDAPVVPMAFEVRDRRGLWRDQLCLRPHRLEAAHEVMHVEGGEQHERDRDPHSPARAQAGNREQRADAEREQQ